MKNETRNEETLGFFKPTGVDPGLPGQPYDHTGKLSVKTGFKRNFTRLVRKAGTGDCGAKRTARHSKRQSDQFQIYSRCHQKNNP